MADVGVCCIRRGRGGEGDVDDMTTTSVVGLSAQLVKLLFSHLTPVLCFYLQKESRHSELKEAELKEDERSRKQYPGAI